MCSNINGTVGSLGAIVVNYTISFGNITEAFVLPMNLIGGNSNSS